MSKIFNDNLTLLQMLIDQLSVILVKETHRLYNQKKTSEIKNVTHLCENTSKQLIETVQEGKKENKWIIRNI